MSTTSHVPAIELAQKRGGLVTGRGGGGRAGEKGGGGTIILGLGVTIGKIEVRAQRREGRRPVGRLAPMRPGCS